jgi:hypothetical protein
MPKIIINKEAVLSKPSVERETIVKNTTQNPTLPLECFIIKL